MRKIVCKLFVLGIFIFICASCSNKSEGLAGEMVLDDTKGSGGGAGAAYYEQAATMEEDIITEDLESVVTSDASYSSGIVTVNAMGANLKLNCVADNLSSSNEKQSPKKENTQKSVGNTDESLLQKKKIIKDGDISIQSKNISFSKEGLDNLVKSLNAYYEKENLEKTDFLISYDLIIRVPANNFEKLVSTVEQSKDEIKSKNIRARDVTEEFVDIKIRLDSKREYLKQYTALLSRANTIKDILEIKENIRILHEEIERAEGRLRFLNDQVAFSTLKVELFQKTDYVYKPEPQDSFIERVKSGLNTGWKIIVETTLFLLNIWSVVLLLIAVFFFVRRRMKKQKAETNKKE